jgi:lysophospholipase L1-like esterase
MKKLSALVLSLALLTFFIPVTAQTLISGDDLLGLKSGADPAKPLPGQAGSSRKKGKPVVFIIGDSTVKNGKGDGSNKQWGWGSFFWQLFDTTKITVENHALGGRSSRTFIDEGLWAKVLNAVQPGDFVLIQFGHNDSGPLNTARARATLKGNGDNDTTVVMEATGKELTIHSFGWYMRKYASDVKAKKATPVLMSHIPRNMWTNNDSTNVIRNSDGFGKWTREAAEMAKVPYIDLNKLVADKYDKLGKKVVPGLFQGDHTHTSLEGARLNAITVAEGIKGLKACKLKKYLKKK